jgi:diguanylate cyclase (GGDEF)-like protein
LPEVERERRNELRRAEDRANATWLPRKLATLLELLSKTQDEHNAIEVAVERIVEDVDAEAAALIRGEDVVFATGPGASTLRRLDVSAVDSGDVVKIGSLGPRWGTFVPLGEDLGLGLLVVRSSDAPLIDVEVSLVEAMGRALLLSLRSLDLVSNERRIRSETEEHAKENARLLSALRERSALLEHLSRLQRSIVDRKPVHEILTDAADATQELLGDDLATVRLVEPDDTGHVAVAASSAAEPGAVGGFGRSPIDYGLSGRAMKQGTLVIADAVNGVAADLPQEVRDQGIAAAMAAPVYERGAAVGTLFVASRNASRAYGPRDQQILLSLAEHVSLALNHSRAVEDALHEAFHDSLTGLPNRALLLDRLDHAITRSQQSGTTPAVLFCDLDGFKTLNDSLGHVLGDRLLTLVGERIAGCAGPADTVARLGGDEFAVLLEEVAQPSEAARVAHGILTALDESFDLRGREVFISASIGIATGLGPAETLLRNADLAMYRAKGRGKGRYAIFEPEMHTAIVERLELEVDLKRAVQRDELVLAYQPIYDLRDRTIKAFEALVRWQHPTLGLVVPDRFIGLAEESGQIAALGRWVLQAACQEAARWQATHPGFEELEVAVNISGVQLREPGLADDVADALETSGLDASSLTLEITETALMEDSETVVGRLEELKELGVDLAVDDFGIGHSSLRYLQRFPLDNLKIDKAFVAGIGIERDVPSLVRAMVDLAQIFDLTVVAEGIERAEQIPDLIALGCELGQGHYLSYPLGPEDANEMLDRAATG